MTRQEIATYSQAGAQFGLSSLWTAPLTFPLMAAIQGMCARIGIVTEVGMTGTLKKHYPNGILYLILVFSSPAITLNFLVKQDWMKILKSTFIPTIHFNKEFFSILVAILGKTISPYLFFWQATMEAEEISHRTKKNMVEKPSTNDKNAGYGFQF
ncbi:MAG: divalent metal cation transporter [Bacteroidia bacterium]